MPCEPPQPQLVPAACASPGRGWRCPCCPSGRCARGGCQGPGFSLPHALLLPRRRSRLPRRSELGAHRHLTSCVQANLSFFFHYLGMYCHLILMYAILPDKYDLLPGNSSDVHSVPCSNYGSAPAAAAGAAEPLLHLSAGSGLPDALSCQSAASKYNQREK